MSHKLTITRMLPCLVDPEKIRVIRELFACQIRLKIMKGVGLR